ncbi:MULTISPECIES: hypothetical protein [unclassified Nostoc]|nr:hypothetical protein [Nostoc sp. JL33]
MSITFSPEQKLIIQALLATGRFNSVDQGIQTALDIRVKKNVET